MKIAALGASIATGIALVLSMAAPAHAGNAVSQPEFWTNLTNVHRSDFQNNICNCQPIQVSYLDPDHNALVAVYNAGIGYSRNVDTILIRFDWNGGAYVAHDFPNNGGKQQNWHDGSGDHTSYYPVACTGAPC